MSNPFDLVVDAAGGRDYTGIDAAFVAPGTFLIKGGLYAGDDTITLDQSGSHLRIEPSTIRANSGGLVLSASNCYLEILPGFVLENESAADALALTISGDNNLIRCKGRANIGNINVSGDGNKIYGGGHGTLISSLYCSGDNLIVRHCRFNSKTAATGRDAVRISGGNGHAKILFCLFEDSDEDAVALHDPDCMVKGCNFYDADGVGIDLHAARAQIIANWLNWTFSPTIRANAGAHDSLIQANVVSVLLQLLSGADDLVVVGNTAFDISDASGTSTVESNELGNATCAITGTVITDSPLESEILAGGEDLYLTLSTSTWRNPIDKSILRGLFTGDHAEANSWNNEVGTIMADGQITRVSDKVVRINFAASSYAITTTDEVVSIADIPASLLVSESNAITPDNTSFTITEGS